MHFTYPDVEIKHLLQLFGSGIHELGKHLGLVSFLFRSLLNRIRIFNGITGSSTSASS